MPTIKVGRSSVPSLRSLPDEQEKNGEKLSINRSNVLRNRPDALTPSPKIAQILPKGKVQCKKHHTRTSSECCSQSPD